MIRLYRKFIILLYISVLSLNTTFAQSLEDILLEGNWSQDLKLWPEEWEGPFMGLEMKFQNENTFSIYSYWYNDIAISGSYYIKGTKIYTKSEDYPWFLQREYNIIPDNSEVIWEFDSIGQNEFNLLYPRRLTSILGNLYDITSLLPVGNTVEIEGTDVILTERNVYKVTANLNVREKPTLESDKCIFSFLIDDELSEVTYLPINRHVLPLARTLEPETIGGFENYWYYVMIYISGGLEFGPSFGWVWGSYIEPVGK